MTGEWTSKQALTSHIGIGSSEHDALDDEWISLQTFAADNGKKPFNCATGAGVSEQGGFTLMLLIESLMRSQSICQSYFVAELDYRDLADYSQ